MATVVHITLHNVSRVRRAQKYNWCLGDTQLLNFSLFCHFHLKGHSWLPVCIRDTGGAANYSGSTTMQGHNVAERCKYRRRRCSLPSFFLRPPSSLSYFFFLLLLPPHVCGPFGLIATSKQQRLLFKCLYPSKTLPD